MKNRMLTTAVLVFFAACSVAFAQKSVSGGTAEYRAMLQEGNPAEVFRS